MTRDILLSLQYIEFHDSWEAYRHAPCVEFLIRDRNFSPSNSVCVVDVFQEGHEGETAAVNVSTRPRKVHIEKVSLLFFKFIIRDAVT